MTYIDKPFYDLPEVSKKLGNCSRSTLYRLIDQGKLVRVNIGSKAVITAESLTSYVEELMATEVSTARRTSDFNLKHGEARTGKTTVEYTCWITMIQRCTNPQATSYKNYGGRGIKICDRWLESYENFLADMGRKPTASHSIDRIDVHGPYSPSNCRWATPTQQAANRRPRRGSSRATPDSAHNG